MGSSLIRLTPNLIARCEKMGREIVANYASGRSDRSLAFSSHGAERDPKVQAHAKMAECAFALWADLDPLRAVRWTGRADAGYDVVLGGIKVDVKGCGARDRLLIWPYRKVPIFDSKDFEVLAHVRGDKPDFLVHRWITKTVFRGKHEVAGERSKLTPGTWFMHEDDLWDIEELLEYAL